MGSTDAGAFLRELLAVHLAPEPTLTVSQWADKHAVLPAVASAERGRYRVERIPFMRAILDDLSVSSPVREIAVIKGTQLGFSTAGLVWMGYVIDQVPAPMMIVQPTVDTAKLYSQQRVTPMILDTPTLAGKVSEPRSRDAVNTTFVKEFDGGILRLTGANSGTGLRSMPARYVHRDEIDEYPDDVDGQGDPLQIIAARTDTFALTKKIFDTSTPTIRNLSKIERRFLQGDQRYYHVPCPHCGHRQRLVWANLRWPSGRPEEAAYACESCGAMIEEHQKTAMLAAGEWVASNPAAPAWMRSYHLSSLYSPVGWVAWAQLAQEWEAAQLEKNRGNIQPLKAFVNTRLAETWAEEVEETTSGELAARAERYPIRQVPVGGLVLVAGVDVQDNRFAILVWAIGRGEEMWVVDHVELTANPADERDWEKLAAYLTTTFEHAAGGKMAIEAAAVDTGGHFTHQAYAFCRLHARRKVLAVRGETRQGMPVKGRSSMQDVNWRGKVLKHGVKLWHVGTDTAKDLFYGRLKVTQEGPGRVHFPQGLALDFYDQLTAEVRVLQKTAQGEQHRWVKRRARNEALDCTVYAIFAAHVLDLHRYTEAMWARLEALVNPRVADLFAAPAPAGEEAPVEPRAVAASVGIDAPGAEPDILGMIARFRRDRASAGIVAGRRK